MAAGKRAAVDKRATPTARVRTLLHSSPTPLRMNALWEAVRGAPEGAGLSKTRFRQGVVRMMMERNEVRARGVWGWWGWWGAGVGVGARGWRVGRMQR